MKMKKATFAYEMFMLALVIISLFFAFSTNPTYVLFDRVIWGIFVTDYITRLILSEKKWEYVKKHPLELIAIIPFDSLFRAARFVRIFRVIRLFGIGTRYTKPVYDVLKTNGLDKLLMITVILLFLVPIPIIIVEPNINTFTDALWWAVVTTTTVGYGDISPSTPIGRVLAVVLMIIGIGIIGTFTSAISSYFTSRKEPSHNQKVLNIIQSIEDIEELTNDDKELIENYIKRKL